MKKLKLSYSLTGPSGTFYPQSGVPAACVPVEVECLEVRCYVVPEDKSKRTSSARVFQRPVPRLTIELYLASSNFDPKQGGSTTKWLTSRISTLSLRTWTSTSVRLDHTPGDSCAAARSSARSATSSIGREAHLPRNPHRTQGGRGAVSWLELQKAGAGYSGSSYSGSPGRQPHDFPFVAADLAPDGDLWRIDVTHNIGDRAVLWQIYDENTGGDIQYEKSWRGDVMLQVWLAWQPARFVVVVL